jgi:hypothetical protein
MTIKKTCITRYETGDGFNLRFEPIEDTIDVTKTDTGYKVRYLTNDEDPSSPSDDCDDGLFLINYHRDCWIERNDIISEDDLRDWYQGKKIWLSLSRSFSSDPGGWDTSHVGAVLVSKKEFKTKDKALKAAESHVEWWNMYLTGDVYGCIIEKFGPGKEYIDHNSCWGFYGLDDAKEALAEFD